MKKNQFTITLNSGASKNIFKNNRASSFKTRLCETIHLPAVSTHWECASALVLIPANYNNISEYCEKIYIRKSFMTRQELIEKYTTPVYEHYTHTIPSSEDRFTADGFADRINKSMLIGEHKNFKVHVSTYGAERKNSQAEWVFNQNENDTTPCFVFQIGLDAKVVFKEDGRQFWKHYLHFPDALIETELETTFVVPIKTHPATPYIRISHPVSFTIHNKSKERRNWESIPKISPEDDLWQIKINHGSYKNEKTLLEEIDNAVDKVIHFEKHTDERRKKIFSFKLNNDNTASVDIFSDRYAIQFPDDLAYALGFKKNEWYSETSNKGLQPIDLHYNLNVIHVYSDIVESSIVSNVKVPLLALMPAEQKPNSRIRAHYFPRLFYYPVNKSHINEISISMAGDYGREIPFSENVEATIKLHFRVYKE